MQYRLVYACVNSANNDASTSCKSLAKICPVTLAENSLECGNCAATRQQYDDRRSFGTLLFENGLEYRYFDFRTLIGNHLCRLCRNCVRFGSMTPEFKTLELVVRLASIILPHSVQLRSLEGGDDMHCGDQ